MLRDSYDAIVIGGGPAGLATSRELRRRGVDHLVLERGDRIGYTWSNLYESLVLHTGKHMSSLPGLPFARGTPLFPSRLDFLNYLDAYVRAFELPVETGAAVETIERRDRGWQVRTADGRVLRTRAVTVATGIVSNPAIPAIPGAEGYRGQLLHSAAYRRAQPFTGQRVLVVGAGNSAGEIAAELAASGARATVAVRSGANVVPRDLLGVPIQYFANLIAVLPRDAQRAIAGAMTRVSQRVRGPSVLPARVGDRCSDVPLIGFHLVDAVKAGTVRLAGAIAAFTAGGVHFSDGRTEDFDSVIMATGYRPALALLGSHARLDACGFALRRDRVTSATEPDLYFVGHNYDLRGALRNIALDGPLAARRIASGLRSSRF